MDVIALYQNNFKTSVAPLGTALTSYQLERAWKICKSPIIMFDGDEAGQAAQRAALLALSILLPDHSLRFCLLPKDYDPDDYLQNNNPSDLRNIIENSLSLSEFVWTSEMEKEDISTPEKKAGFEKRINALSKNIDNKTVREYYIKFFNDKLMNLKYENINTGKFDYRLKKIKFPLKFLKVTESKSKVTIQGWRENHINLFN